MDKNEQIRSLRIEVVLRYNTLSQIQHFLLVTFFLILNNNIVLAFLGFELVSELLWIQKSTSIIASRTPTSRVLCNKTKNECLKDETKKKQLKLSNESTSAVLLKKKMYEDMFLLSIKLTVAQRDTCRLYHAFQHYYINLF